MQPLRDLGRARRLLVAVVVGTGAFGIASAVQADIPDSGVIQGCYGKAGTPGRGQLRVRDASQGEQCRSSELPLSWNQTGPTGPRGPVGPTGKRGPTGSQGVPGQQGPKGPTGGRGPTGAAGSGTAYTSYADGFQRIDNGLTKTIASVTLPAGDYTLDGTVSAVQANAGDPVNVSCGYVSFYTVHGWASLLQLDPIEGAKEPLIGDVTMGSDNQSVYLRCTSLDGSADVGGEMIATRVGAITPSS